MQLLLSGPKAKIKSPVLVVVSFVFSPGGQGRKNPSLAPPLSPRVPPGFGSGGRAGPRLRRHGPSPIPRPRHDNFRSPPHRRSGNARHASFGLHCRRGNPGKDRLFPQPSGPGGPQLPVTACQAGFDKRRNGGRTSSSSRIRFAARGNRCVSSPTRGTATRDRKSVV